MCKSYDRYSPYLVTKGLPFREAHEIIGRIVLYAIQAKKYLLDLTLEEYHSFNTLFSDDIYDVLSSMNVYEDRLVIM